MHRTIKPGFVSNVGSTLSIWFERIGVSSPANNRVILEEDNTLPSKMKMGYS